MAFQFYSRESPAQLPAVPICSPEERNKLVNVMRILVGQINDLQLDLPLEDGRLDGFRTALETAEFPLLVQLIQRKTGRQLFSTVSQIKSLEAACRDNRRTELIVQCCLVLDFGLTTRLVRRDFFRPVDHQGWLFRDCKDLRQVADLLYRLRFVKANSMFGLDIAAEIVMAVRRIVANSKATWHGLLLVLKAAPSNSDKLYWLFESLYDLLEDEAWKIPKAAATLFLSFVSDAVYDSIASECPYPALLVENLLERGASLAVSTDDHAAIFESLKQQTPGVWPFWLDEMIEEPRMTKRRPTALNRLLGLQWCPAFMEVLSKHMCCNLDFVPSESDGLDMKVPSLKCLAYQRLSEAEMKNVPSALTCLGWKHLPLPLDQCRIEPF